MAQGAVFTPDAAAKVAQATRRVLGYHSTSLDRDFTPFMTQPVFRVKITGEADANGVYPGKLMRLKSEDLTWVEMGDCYAFKVDTI